MDQCVLKLYVAGHTDRSESAISNLRRIAEDHLRGQCKLIIIDLLERPQFAKEGKILATPTLIKESPALLAGLSEISPIWRRLCSVWTCAAAAAIPTVPGDNMTVHTPYSRIKKLETMRVGSLTQGVGLASSIL